MPRRREVIAKRIAELEPELTALKAEDRKLEVAECDHDWRDEGYINGHNGNDEDCWRCRDCRSVRYSPPC